jgi:predicted hotdog family 3-hydroxylacyl-ACP dehydratase
VTALLDHPAIEALVPHKGSMCLLASVRSSDADRIHCTATSHTDPGNPLRSRSGLLASAAIEYAAQAAAVHGALVSRSTGHAGQPGFLASARGVAFHCLRLDDLPGELDVHAERSAGDARQLLYTFDVSHRGQPVAHGRLAVVLDTAIGA